MELSDFKPIPEHPAYLIAKDGRVWSTKSNKLLSSYITNEGYRRVGFTENNVVKQYLLHRLLARVYLSLPSLDSELEVDHKDSNRLNNALENLNVLTKLEHCKKSALDRGFTVHNHEPLCVSCNSVLVNIEATRCLACYKSSRFERTKDITEKEIETAVSSTGSWVKAAKIFGLSDNGLRKVYVRITGKDPKLLKKQINAS